MSSPSEERSIVTRNIRSLEVAGSDDGGAAQNPWASEPADSGGPGAAPLPGPTFRPADNTMCKAWQHEGDLTEWLANNIDQMSTLLPFNLTAVAREGAVAGLRADLIAVDKNDKLVIIENQFGWSDHKHLGQLVTYCAELGSDVGIWVAEYFGERHLSAIRHLNMSMRDNRFFAVQVTRPANGAKPFLNRVDETLAGMGPSADGALARQHVRALADFWQRYRDHAPDWIFHGIGIGGLERASKPCATLDITINLKLALHKDGRMTPSVYLNGADWDSLCQADPGHWERALDSSVRHNGPNFDKWLPEIRWTPDDRDGWDVAIKQMKDRADMMHRVLTEHLRSA